MQIHCCSARRKDEIELRVSQNRQLYEVYATRFHAQTWNPCSEIMPRRNPYISVEERNSKSKSNSTTEEEMVANTKPIQQKMIIIKPILMAFLTSNAVKELVISLLEAYAGSTDNTIDDQAVQLIKKNLFPGLKE